MNELNFVSNQEAEQQVPNQQQVPNHHGHSCQENHHHQNGSLSLLHSLLYVVVVFEFEKFGKAKTTRKIDFARSQIIDYHTNSSIKQILFNSDFHSFLKVSNQPNSLRIKKCFAYKKLTNIKITRIMMLSQSQSQNINVSSCNLIALCG